MPRRSAKAEWNGTLKDGQGRMKMASGAWEGPYSFGSRFEDEPGTNPEELIAAAHAGCFSMALAGELSRVGFSPRRVATEARVTLGKAEGAPAITKIHLVCEAEVPDAEEEAFQEAAEGAKKGCPVSKALAGPEITLEAKLV